MIPNEISAIFARAQCFTFFLLLHRLCRNPVRFNQERKTERAGKPRYRISRREYTPDCIPPLIFVLYRALIRFGIYCAGAEIHFCPPSIPALTNK